MREFSEDFPKIPRWVLDEARTGLQAEADYLDHQARQTGGQLAEDLRGAAVRLRMLAQGLTGY